MKTNNKTAVAKRQANSFKYLYDPNPTKQLRNNPVRHMISSKRYSLLELMVAHELIERRRKHSFVQYTHEEIANIVGCDPKTVLSAETKLCEDGLLIIQRRNHKRRPTLGRLSSYLNEKTPRRSLGLFIPALKDIKRVVPLVLTPDNYEMDKFLLATLGDTLYLINLKDYKIGDSNPKERYLHKNGYPPWAENYGIEAEDPGVPGIEDLLTTALGLPRC